MLKLTRVIINDSMYMPAAVYRLMSRCNVKFQPPKSHTDCNTASLDDQDMTQHTKSALKINSDRKFLTVFFFFFIK